MAGVANTKRRIRLARLASLAVACTLGSLSSPVVGEAQRSPQSYSISQIMAPSGYAHMPGSAYLPAGTVSSVGRFRPTRCSPLSGRSTLIPIGARETPFLTLERIEEEEGSPCHFRVSSKWQPLGRRAT